MPARSQGGGWADMMVENPVTGKVEDRTSGWLAEEDIVVGCGSNK